MDRSELWGIRFRNEYLPVDYTNIKSFFGSWQTELVDSYQQDGQIFVFFKNENEAKLIDGSMKGLLRCQLMVTSKKSTTIINHSKAIDSTITVKIENFPKEHRDALLLKCCASEPSKLTLNNDELTIRAYFREHIEIGQAMKLIEQLMKLKLEQKIKMDILMERVTDGDETIQDKANHNNSFTPSLHSTACNGNRSEEDTFNQQSDDGERVPTTGLRTVWVGGMSAEATKSDLQKIFADYNAFISNVIVCNKDTYSFGFVEMINEEVAQKASNDNKLLSCILHGKRLTFRLSAQNPRNKPNMRPSGGGDFPSNESRGNFRPQPALTPARQPSSSPGSVPTRQPPSSPGPVPFRQAPSSPAHVPVAKVNSDSPKPASQNQPDGSGSLNDEPSKEVALKQKSISFPNSLDPIFLSKLYEKVFNYRGQDLIPLLLDAAKNKATDRIQVMVTEIIDDHHFWAMLGDFPERKEMADQFEWLAKSLNIETNHSVPPPETAIGCAAKFENAWYRAWILKRMPEFFIVFFVDYGNFAQVPIADVCALEEDSHWSMPARAIPCRLSGIEGRTVKLQDLEATPCSMAVERFDESTLLVHARLHC